jgi:hypothetical protein
MDAFMQKVIAQAQLSDYSLTFADFNVLQNATKHEERMGVVLKIGCIMDRALFEEITALPLSSGTTSDGNVVPIATLASGASSLGGGSVASDSTSHSSSALGGGSSANGGSTVSGGSAAGEVGGGSAAGGGFQGMVAGASSVGGGSSEATVAGEAAIAQMNADVRRIMAPHKFTGTVTGDARKDLRLAVCWLGTKQDRCFVQDKEGGGSSKVVFKCNCGKCPRKIIAALKNGTNKGGGYWMLHKNTEVDDFMKSTRCTSKVRVIICSLSLSLSQTNNSKPPPPYRLCSLPHPTTPQANPSTLELKYMLGSDIKINPRMTAKNGLKLCQERGAPDATAKSIYNTKEAVKKEELDTYHTDFSRMPEFFERFVRQNSGSVAKVFTTERSYRTATGTHNLKHFTKAFVVFKPCVDIIRKVGLPTHYLDGTFSNHAIYNGVYLFLVGRDSNNNILLLALMVCEKEDGDSYGKFAEELVNAGCGDIFGVAQPADEEEAAYVSSDLFNGERPVVLCDRGKGMNTFFDGPLAEKKLRRLWCCWHLLNNCNGNVKKGEGLTRKDYWGLQGSESEEEFVRKYRTLKKTHPAAIAYLDKFDRKEWVCYAMMKKNGDVCLHNHTTNGPVESANNVFKEIREKGPLQVLQHIFLKVSATIQSRHEEAEKLLAEPADKRKLFTEYYNQIFKGQHFMVKDYTALSMDPPNVGYIAYKGNLDKAHQVDLREKSPCSSCNFRNNNGVDCVHILKFLTQASGGGGLNWEDYSKSDRCPNYTRLTNYADAYKNAALIVPVLQEIKPKDISLNILEDGTTVPVDPSAIHQPLHRKKPKRGPKKRKPYPSKGLLATTHSHESITASTTIDFVPGERSRRAGAGTNRHRGGGR